MKVKIFFSGNFTGKLEFQDQINAWLEKNDNIKIEKIKQSTANMNIVITIWYSQTHIKM